MRTLLLLMSRDATRAAAVPLRHSRGVIICHVLATCRVFSTSAVHEQPRPGSFRQLRMAPQAQAGALYVVRVLVIVMGYEFCFGLPRPSRIQRRLVDLTILSETTSPAAHFRALRSQSAACQTFNWSSLCSIACRSYLSLLARFTSRKLLTSDSRTARPPQKG